MESQDPNNPETRINYDEVIAQIAVRENKILIGLDIMTGVIARENAFRRKAEKNQASYTFAEKVYATFSDTAAFDPQLMNEIQDCLADNSGDNSESLDTAAWFAGNTAWLTQKREGQARRFPRFNEKLTIAREKIWLGYLSNDLQSTQRPICIAIGYNHLVGNDGIVAQLAKRGFEVQQVRFSDCASGTLTLP